MVSLKKELKKPKTKIIATIGPASSKKTILKKILKYASILRINLAHGSREDREKLIELINKVSEEENRNISILADLPGPKMRIGKIEEPISLKRGEKIILYVENEKDNISEETRIPVEFKDFTKIVKKNSYVYLCDGTIKLKVNEVRKNEVVCTVLCGGVVTSRRGINVPGAINVSIPTEQDKKLLKELEGKVDAIGISFVGCREDVERVRKLTDAFLIAKIERDVAVKNINGILKAADGIMIARGDLGVEIPIQEVAVVQKKLIMKANLASKPVITATQMLESMTEDVRPTRAEVTDVANAILDGSDALMLSEETAIGKYPVEAVETMAAIAKLTEKYRNELSENRVLNLIKSSCKNTVDAITLSIVQTMNCIDIDYIIARTRSGKTARHISRFKPQCWIFAFTTNEKVRKNLNFSYGVIAFNLKDRDDKTIVDYLRNEGISGKVILTEESRIDEKVRIGTNTIKILDI